MAERKDKGEPVPQRGKRPGEPRGEDAKDKLSTYRRKRDFTRTPEPAGPGQGADAVQTQPETAPAAPAGAQPGALRFVVQRHRARRTHYDLRFEIGGVLASWAVPRGPTLDPAVKRTAIHVEDHPIEYLEFEGVIPAGEYGGGDVIVWDLGTWEPHATDDPASAVAAGELHADVNGHKLKGRLVLVRRDRDGDSRGQEQWLLLHKRDEYAVAGWDPEEHPRSVLSGRTNDEVKADPERMWQPDLPPSQASVLLRPPTVPRPSDAEFAALDGLGQSGKWEVFGRTLALTNLDKVLFPSPGPGEPAVTKREFIRYAAEIAPAALPYLEGRALNMHRFPGGAETGGFWHKQLPDHAPAWLPRWHRPDAGPREATTYLVVDEPAALVWAANFGALEWHAWTSRIDEPSLPTYVLIDLDPGPATSWDDLLVLARLHRTALTHLGVVGCAKVTGRRGIQVWVPIARGPSFAETREWAAGLSKAVGAVVPNLVSWKWDVKDRGGLARLDYTQNVVNKTLVAPYSPRAAPGAPVSAPISWDELDDPSLRPDAFTVRTMPDRLATHGDLFRPVLTSPQALPPLR
ncbi:MAG TPA: DNA polymerase ligase N-terminal domain-containing protein [Streptosporangiaceae bacterium]|nr:DNA polymerase ligase N-terminal domain-containing protein [Streptosporangiaceae bacterium]